MFGRMEDITERRTLVSLCLLKMDSRLAFRGEKTCKHTCTHRHTHTHTHTLQTLSQSVHTFELTVSHVPGNTLSFITCKHMYTQSLSRALAHKHTHTQTLLSVTTSSSFSVSYITLSEKDISPPPVYFSSL